MAIVKMKDKMNGEIRDVELDGAEFRALQAQVTPAGFPKWEQTNHPHAAGIKERASYAELIESDLGEDYKELLKHEALIMDAEGVGPEQNPHLALSPGEVEAGLTPKTKLEQIRQQFAPSVLTREEILQRAAEHLADGEVKPRQAKVAAKGLRARAGGTDQREGVPTVNAQDQHEDDGSGDDAGKSQAELAASGADEESGEAGGEE